MLGAFVGGDEALGEGLADGEVLEGCLFLKAPSLGLRPRSFDEGLTAGLMSSSSSSEAVAVEVEASERWRGGDEG